jgi:hypothetical protein
VPSLAKPGGNITGVSLIAAEMHGKCVELFRDMLPSLRRVGALVSAADPFSKPFLEQVQLAGKTTGLDIAPTMVRGPQVGRTREPEERRCRRSCRSGEFSVKDRRGSGGKVRPAGGYSSSIFC